MTTEPSIDLLAAAAAFVFPGAGHALRRKTRRALFAATGVLGLFFGGILIGGIDVIDREEDKWWFLGQAAVGPLAFAVNYYHQNHCKAYEIPDYLIGPGAAIEQEQLDLARKRSLYPGEARTIATVNIRDRAGGTTQASLPVVTAATPGQNRPNIKSIGRINELGMLAATIAGMLNFIIILDALIPGRPPEKKAAP